MTRKITASAKSKTKDVKSMKINIEINTEFLTRDQVDDVVEKLKNKAFDMLRQEGYLLQDIKTN